MSRRGSGPAVLAVLLASALALGFAPAGCHRKERASLPPPQRGPTATQRAMDHFRQPDRLVAALGLRPGERVADVGAGAGYLSFRLARAVGPSGRVIATDIDARALGALRARAEREHVENIETRLVRPDSPGLPERCCDLVLLAEVDHYLRDRAAYLEALRPSLRPGGRIVVSNRRFALEPVLRAARQASFAPTELPLHLPGQFVLVLAPIDREPRPK